MKKARSVSWWSSLAQRHGAPAPDTDYADMGTAFGLDASLAPPPTAADDRDEDEERTPPDDARPASAPD